MLAPIPHNPRAADVNLLTIEASLDALAESIPRVEPELRSALSTNAARFDAEVRRLRHARAAAALS
jgi:hypothetical protein